MDPSAGTPDAQPERLRRLEVGQPILYGGDRIVRVDADLAAAFEPGDRLIVLQDTGHLLHVPAAEQAAACSAVDAAVEAFARLGSCPEDAVDTFFDLFADHLDDPGRVGPILEANAADVARAAAAGRSTTRLVMTDSMRAGMVAGLRAWRESALRRDTAGEEITHAGWIVESRRAPLGVVGFVFEGRPNVCADATGVLRTGNTVVMRIGSDALGTAEAIVTHALAPALAGAGLPPGTVSLVRSPARAAGWALFDDPRLALAVARGSGAAVAQLGAVARQAGTPVSLHGTGGAWLVAAEQADAERLRAAVINSLDRKVCNTLNVCCLPRSRPDLIPVLLEAVEEAGRRRVTASRLHVERSSRDAFPASCFTTEVTVTRADGDHREPFASVIEEPDLAREWEWEHSPELSVVVVDSIERAVELCNRYSPHFIASLISEDPDDHRRFYESVDAPFVGDGFTRWVDGQYALSTPELGLSNWQGGRLLARGGILSGGSVHTIRYRAHIQDPDLHR